MPCVRGSVSLRIPSIDWVGTLSSIFVAEGAARRIPACSCHPERSEGSRSGSGACTMVLPQGLARVSCSVRLPPRGFLSLGRQRKEPKKADPDCSARCAGPRACAGRADGHPWPAARERVHRAHTSCSSRAVPPLPKGDEDQEPSQRTLALLPLPLPLLLLLLLPLLLTLPALASAEQRSRAREQGAPVRAHGWASSRRLAPGEQRRAPRAAGRRPPRGRLWLLSPRGK